ncbi:hypothetical protein, partial [Yoonia sp.]|uniref:hypothetical protein n=1 Tax=Yoonia sp. TaxID=2212373 RepID=UPI0039755A81
IHKFGFIRKGGRHVPDDQTIKMTAPMIAPRTPTACIVPSAMRSERAYVGYMVFTLLIYDDGSGITGGVKCFVGSASALADPVASRTLGF